MISISALIWLLLLAFACNDGEELLTMESGLRAQFAVAVTVVGSVALTVSVLGARTFAETGTIHGLFVAALTVMFLDGVKHILISLYLRQYTSGVVSAALVEVPYTVYTFYRFLDAGLVTWGGILRYGLIGVAVLFPVLWLGFALGRRLVPVRTGQSHLLPTDEMSVIRPR